MTVEEVAEILKVSVGTIRKWRFERTERLPRWQVSTFPAVVSRAVYCGARSGTVLLGNQEERRKKRHTV
ncbi:helix-turn-helix domain-containing protein [Paractinoplanes rishiriensis]|uniref:helix-turn-helix domain-containing protein n=1 Tax=Paractinoplanes rishiriensis TaxID=1050105 RepID=UPI001944DA87